LALERPFLARGASFQGVALGAESRVLGETDFRMSPRRQRALNLKTADALGLSVPPVLVATADELIE